VAVKGLRTWTVGSVRLRAITVCAVLALGLSACGGNGSSSEPVSNVTSAGSPSGTDAVGGSSADTGLPHAQVLPVLDPDAPSPTEAGLEAVLGPHLTRKGLGPQVLAQVVDVTAGTIVLSREATTPGTPASSAKLFTATAALSALGPETTLTTRAVAGATPDEVILVGGGDVLLCADKGKPDEVVGRAGLNDLAQATAQKLKEQGRPSVSLRLDDHIYTGPSRSPHWGPGDIASGYVSPIMALEIDRGSVGGMVGRQSDPAMAAAKTFAAGLKKHGITVNPRITRGTAPDDAELLAQIESASIAELVEFALTHSDNTVAETLARAVAVSAGRPGSFEEAGAAVVQEAQRLGVQVENVSLSDGSGLGRDSLATVQALTGLLVTAASEAHPELRSLLTGLPVAGASGTLAERFSASGQRSARGLIRAKTGTLTGVHALAGTVLDADGRLLAFAFMAPHAGSTSVARSALDSAAAALAGCGCN
jgi:serine-type D-Ala-D-Ala carboxypeptidase/endopeptidase (penicillin-binding protein 4)